MSILCVYVVSTSFFGSFDIIYDVLGAAFFFSATSIKSNNILFRDTTNMA